LHVREDEVETVAPSVLQERRGLEACDERADGAEKMLDEGGYLRFGQLAEIDRIGKEQRGHARVEAGRFSRLRGVRGLRAVWVGEDVRAFVRKCERHEFGVELLGANGGQPLQQEARVIVGHGQLSEGELERVMFNFVRHEADVLVATTIIENGLDIPLCNTMIVNRADRHGLSELYQLRGRVGRSNRRAYAYLMVPADVELTPLARRRLAALKEFSDLGAGFKIAALDLELRGAGNMLGGEQSGHVDAVGFELYTSMLERTVRELKGDVEPDEAETQLNLGLNIRIPNEYIPEENQRLRMYKRVAAVESEKQLTEVRGELEDRYGTSPPAVRNLLEYAALKLLAKRIGVAGIERKRDGVNVRFNPNASIEPERLAHFVATHHGSQFSPAGVLKFSLKATASEEVLGQLRSLLFDLAGEIEPTANQLAN